MPLNIRPIVDFAFKMIFGQPQNSLALIGLLNAILKLPHPIESVQVLNPFNYQEFADAKQIVLDIKAQDASGRWLNIEMQVAVLGGLMERLVYYACSMYVEQLAVGQDYLDLHPAISICLLNQTLFEETDQAHHRFQMVDAASGRQLERAIEVHTVELPKYNLDERTISTASKLEQWVFLLLYAQDYEPDRLRELLPGIEYQVAIKTLERISEKTEDRIMYDQRKKALLDHQWIISGALQQGREKGLEEGRKEGRKEGREEGREEGQKLGRKEGLAGKIQMLQELLGDEISNVQQLLSQPDERLQTSIDDLQKRMRNRMA